MTIMSEAARATVLGRDSPLIGRGSGSGSVNKNSGFSLPPETSVDEVSPKGAWVGPAAHVCRST
jgi:hypothetical protein